MTFITPENFLLFAFASFMLNITPGNDMIYVATRSVGLGVKAGILSAFGIALGCLVHTAASVFGLSAAIARSAALFNAIKTAGAAYLIYLGVRAILSRTSGFGSHGAVQVDAGKVLVQGIVTNVLNPKVALFFLAFLPQFVDFDAGNVPLQLTVLGVWFNMSGTAVNIIVAVAVGKAGNLLAARPSFWKWQSRFTGAVLCALGVRLALARES